MYLLWGSTYFAIRVGVHPAHGAAMPPLLMAGTRFTAAGVILLSAGAARPAADRLPDRFGRRQWLAAAVIGILLLLAGNGVVSVAEQEVPSGVAALALATVPLWAALIDAAAGGGLASWRQAAGLLLGFVGVALLVAPGGAGQVHAGGVLLVVAAAAAWAAGSVWSRTAPSMRRPLVMTGMEMVCGGIATLLAGMLAGEQHELRLTHISAQGWLALAYLIVFGSVAGFTAYTWLLRNAPLPLVTTYAFVNPLVAVTLGGVFLGEQLSIRTAGAGVAIVSSVLLIVRTSRPARRPRALRLDAMAAADERV